MPPTVMSGIFVVLVCNEIEPMLICCVPAISATSALEYCVVSEQVRPLAATGIVVKLLTRLPVLATTAT